MWSPVFINWGDGDWKKGKEKKITGCDQLLRKDDEPTCQKQARNLKIFNS